jgi:hypothetical protein
MKHIIATIILGFSVYTAQSQTVYSNTISQNSASAIIGNNGTFFHDYANQRGGYVVPKDSSISAIYLMNIMAKGTDNNGQLKAALTDYNDSDFQPGPVATDYSDSLYQARFDQSIWTISKSEIDDHLANWNTQGYTPSAAITNWPGNGNTQNGEANILAPFFDQNYDGIYTPLEGDYPLIRGDKATFVILNDDMLHPSGAEPIKTEVHLLFYQYNSDYPSIEFTTFINATFYNRGTQTLYNFQCGSIIDFDLGNYSDDFIGTAPATNLAYVYNGDPNDGPINGYPGFGTSPPAVGIVTLNQPLYSHIPLGSNEPPSTPVGNANLMMGLHSDGTPFIKPDSSITRYIYDDHTPGGWNEYTINNPQGDRKSIISFDGTTFAPATILCYDMAVVYAPGGSQIMDAVDSLIVVADAVKDFYDQQSYVCFGQVAGTDEMQTPVLHLYPNPANDILHVEGIQTGTFRILSPDGKMVFSGVLDSSEIQIGHLKAGYYLLIPDAAPESAQPFLKN